MLVFIHINKTGGNTVSHILRSSYGVRHCQVEPWDGPFESWTDPPFRSEDLRRLRRLYPNLKSIAGHRIFGHVDLEDREDDDFRYFTLVRDPLRSCASRFQYKIQISGKDFVFDEWIQQDSSRNHQTKWIAGVDDVSEAIRVIREKNIFVGLTERFDESMVMLKGLLADDLNISYKRVNVAPDNRIKNRLLEGERTRQMLTEAQEADLELYDYVKEELYPRFRREYGSTLDADVARYRKRQTSASFNHWNLTMARLKHYMVYVPLMKLHRRGVELVRPDV